MGMILRKRHWEGSRIICDLVITVTGNHLAATLEINAGMWEMLQLFIVLILAREVDDLDQDVGDAAGDKEAAAEQHVFVKVKLTWLTGK